MPNDNISDILPMFGARRNSFYQFTVFAFFWRLRWVIYQMKTFTIYILNEKQLEYAATRHHQWLAFVLWQIIDSEPTFCFSWWLWITIISINVKCIILACEKRRTKDAAFHGVWISWWIMANDEDSETTKPIFMLLLCQKI